MEVIRGLMQLLEDAGSIAKTFYAQILLECDVDQVIDADNSLRGKSCKLISSVDSADRESRRPLMDKSIASHHFKQSHRLMTHR